MIGNSSSENSFKKIQNYIFNFNQMLGQGNFSKVYKGHHEHTGQAVAIKIIELNSLKSKKLQELLFSQIDILKKLNHPNVLRCHEVFTSNRNCYIVTELCNQGDLETRLKTKRLMKEVQAEPFIRDIFRGLLYLADNHIIHRDLKVANIFLHDNTAKIADFGFARLTKNKFKDINIGSPIYMSPEGLIENIYGPKTDVWAFGMLIFELLHGETPFSHCKSENELKYNMSIPIGWSQLKPQLSNQIKEVILKCLEVDEHKRVTMGELGRVSFFRKKDDGLATSWSQRQLGSKYRITTQNNYVAKKMEREMSDHPIRSPHYDEEKNKYPSSFKKIDINNDTGLTNLSNRQALSSKQLTSLGRKQNRDAILSTRVTFKECVNILHYCRLLFKHLMLMRELQFGDENQQSIFRRWLGTILKRLMVEINEKKVDYSGQNSAARQSKLQEVTNEYIKKYTKQLDLDLSKIRLEQSAVINYDKISSYFISIFQVIDQEVNRSSSRSMLQMANSIVMICNSTKILKKCYEIGDYKDVAKLKEVEDFLAKGKTAADYTLYWHNKQLLL